MQHAADDMPPAQVRDLEAENLELKRTVLKLRTMCAAERASERAFVCFCVRVCVHACVRVCARVNVCMRACVCICACVRACVPKWLAAQR